VFLVVLTVKDSRRFGKRLARYPAEMTDFGSAASLGQRLQAIRKARRMSVRELALAIGGSPGQSTIENIELGRKAAVDIVQLLNIAMALRVPLVFLLAPIGRTDDPLDLPGLSAEFESRTVAEFDAWLAGLPDGARRASSLDERTTTAELEALRLWKRLSAEVVRLKVALELEEKLIGEPTQVNSTRQRLDDAVIATERQATLLRSAGWPL
jgi:transcriptional regulator with XRE-family HTH domain